MKKSSAWRRGEQDRETEDDTGDGENDDVSSSPNLLIIDLMCITAIMSEDVQVDDHTCQFGSHLLEFYFH